MKCTFHFTADIIKSFTNKNHAQKVCKTTTEVMLNFHGIDNNLFSKLNVYKNVCWKTFHIYLKKKKYF